MQIVFDREPFGIERHEPELSIPNVSRDVWHAVLLATIAQLISFGTNQAEDLARLQHTGSAASPYVTSATHSLGCWSTLPRPAPAQLWASALPRKLHSPNLNPSMGISWSRTLLVLRCVPSTLWLVCSSHTFAFQTHHPNHPKPQASINFVQFLAVF